MTFTTGLAQPDILMVRIAQTADCRTALLANHSHLTARQNNRNPVTFFSHNSRDTAGTSDQFPALAGPHLNIVNLKTTRYRF
jgi:hypothetical protein